MNFSVTFSRRLDQLKASGAMVISHVKCAVKVLYVAEGTLATLEVAYKSFILLIQEL
tara:strand:- start:277 stop:447 length:171 start_codon:yes stop_codon:yes gene_type:complete